MKNLLVILINFVYGIIPCKGTVISLFGGIQKNATVSSFISVFTYADESYSIFDIMTITRTCSFSVFSFYANSNGSCVAFLSFLSIAPSTGSMIAGFISIGREVRFAVLNIFALAGEEVSGFCSLFSYTNNRKDNVKITVGLLNLCKEDFTKKP